MRSAIFVLTMVAVYLAIGWAMESEFPWFGYSSAILLFAAGLCVWNGKRSSEASNRDSQTRNRSLLDYVTLALALLAVLAAVASTMVAVDRSERLVSQGLWNSEASNSDEAETSELESGARSWDAEGEHRLAKQSNVQLKNTPEVFVSFIGDGGSELLKKTRVYLRGSTFSEFDGERWKANDRYKKVLSSHHETVEIAEAVAGFPVIEHEVTARSSGAGQDLLYALQGLRSADLELLTEVAPSIFLLPSQEGQTWSYRVRSQLITDELLAGQNPAALAGETNDSFLQLEEGLLTEEEWAELFSEIESSGSLVETLGEIRGLLRDRCAYSLTVKNFSEKAALQNFLFTERKGYCEHYASAAAILCRKLGIPSRIAYGYLGGVYYPKQGVKLFRARDAHAWTEVYVQDYGWVVFDTTPEDAQVEEEAPVSAELPSLEELDEEQEEGQEDEQPWLWALLLCGGLVGASIVVFLWKSREEAASLAQKGKPKAPSYFVAFQSLCSQAGVEGVETKSVRELVAALSQQGGDEAALSELETYHNGILYRGEPRDKKREKLLLKEVQRLHF